MLRSRPPAGRKRAGPRALRNAGHERPYVGASDVVAVGRLPKGSLGVMFRRATDRGEPS